MRNINFSEKGLGLISPSYLVYDFSRKNFLMLHSINWSNFIVCLTLLLEILGNMCIEIVYSPGCEVINFEINFIFLIKPFWYMTRKWRQKLKYFENKGLSVPKNCLRHGRAPLHILNFSNNMHPNIKSRIEKQVNHSIAFLDVFISGINNKKYHTSNISKMDL